MQGLTIANLILNDQQVMTFIHNTGGIDECYFYAPHLKHFVHHLQTA